MRLCWFSSCRITEYEYKCAPRKELVIASDSENPVGTCPAAEDRIFTVGQSSSNRFEEEKDRQKFYSKISEANKSTASFSGQDNTSSVDRITRKVNYWQLVA